MSKLKSDIIQKIYKDKYKCKQGHNIIWKGKSHIFSVDLSCGKCGNKSNLESPIRWCCSQCNTYYCTNCFDLISDKCCPAKHRYKFSKKGMYEISTNFTCDKCGKSLYYQDGVLIDKECNITICSKCFCESCDIPDIIED